MLISNSLLSRLTRGHKKRSLFHLLSTFAFSSFRERSKKSSFNQQDDDHDGNTFWKKGLLDDNTCLTFLKDTPAIAANVMGGWEFKSLPSLCFFWFPSCLAGKYHSRIITKCCLSCRVLKIYKRKSISRKEREMCPHTCKRIEPIEYMHNNELSELIAEINFKHFFFFSYSIFYLVFLWEKGCCVKSLKTIFWHKKIFSIISVFIWIGWFPSHSLTFTRSAHPTSQTHKWEFIIIFFFLLRSSAREKKKKWKKKFKFWY